jgi:ceramide glucosyltransferase
MRTSFDALDWALGLLFVSALGSCIFLNWAAARKRQKPEPRKQPQPPISILKPLCGMDEGLYDNLVSFAEQRYPEFEIIFAVADPRDPALTAVERLRRAYPDAQLRVLVHGEDDPGANPKVISLLHMARVARYQHILVSDSNVRVSTDYLSAMTAEMNHPDVGLVSSVIVGAGDQSLGAQCENLHLNTFVVGGVAMGDITDRPVVVGKSMLMRRDQLQSLGGFEALRDILAEDYVLGQRYHDNGYRVVLSTHPIVTYNRRMQMRRFLARHLRWAQLRRTCALGPFMMEPLLYASPFLAAPLLRAESDACYQTCVLGLTLRIALDAACAKRISGRWPNWSVLLFLPVKDTLMLGVWTVALVSRRVHWRGHSLRIGHGSRLLPPTIRAPSFRERLATVWQ